ncbi:hypothetical protein [Methanocalculus sp.]|uniref:DUF7557 family protein n=1 Tax=Methanocalculus sp. TaxID=2004547 RepID=UPI00262C9311|nr:hypothetical protein [Methanocalculus sp.]MDG6249752.1 hypothetical protein [Methanocalculus sp.]
MRTGTSIRIRCDLRDQLESLKHHPKESYNDVIERLLRLAIDDEPLGEEAEIGLEEALKEMKAGKFIPESEIMKEYGIR